MGKNRHLQRGKRLPPPFDLPFTSFSSSSDPRQFCCHSTVACCHSTAPSLSLLTGSCVCVYVCVCCLDRLTTKLQILWFVALFFNFFFICVSVTQSAIWHISDGSRLCLVHWVLTNKMLRYRFFLVLVHFGFTLTYLTCLADWNRLLLHFIESEGFILSSLMVTNGSWSSVGNIWIWLSKLYLIRLDWKCI